MDWIDHERVLAGLTPREKGECFTGVDVSFFITHEDPKGLKPKHGHTWKVTAWFPAGQDGRDILPKVEELANQLHGTHMARVWGEGIAAAFGRRLQGCVAVDVSRDDEPFKARWSRK